MLSAARLRMPFSSGLLWTSRNGPWCGQYQNEMLNSMLKWFCVPLAGAAVRE